MKIAIIYSFWHYRSLEACLNISDLDIIYIKNSTYNALPELSSYNNVKILPDRYFGSFASNLQHGRDDLLFSVFNKTITLYCADLINPRSCLIYSILQKRNQLNVCFLYDGTLSLVIATPNLKYRVLDLLRYILFLSVYRISYPTKKRFFTGLDFDQVQTQLIPENINATFDYKTQKIPIFTPSKRNDSRDMIIYIEQNIALMNTKYEYWLQMLHSYVDSVFPHLELVIARHPHSNLQHKNELPRSSRTLEEDIFDLQPSHLISHNSSALVNVRAMGFSGEIIALNPVQFTLDVGRSQKSAIEARKLFDQNKIKVVEF